MSFVNTLPYISNPIDEFKNYTYVSWEKDIYPKFKGGIKETEVQFLLNIIKKCKLKNIIDLGVGGGIELSGILKQAEKARVVLENVEANEIDDDFIMRAQALFYQEKQNVLIHKANWLDLPTATPAYGHTLDFAFLTGNSLTYIGGGTREYTKKRNKVWLVNLPSLFEGADTCSSIHVTMTTSNH